MFLDILEGKLLNRKACPKCLLAQWGHLRFIFYWPGDVLGNFYWTGASRSLLVSGPELPALCPHATRGNKRDHHHLL